MPDFFLRLNDPLNPVYEVDWDRSTWKLFGSSMGSMELGGALKDGGQKFRSESFVQVWKIQEDGGNSFFSTTNPQNKAS